LRNKAIEETRQLLFQNSQMKQTVELEVKQNEILQQVTLNEKHRFILPSDPHALIDLQNLGFSQNQIHRLDNYLLKTSKKRLMPNREKNFLNADKMAEPEGFTAVECGVTEAIIGKDQVKTQISYWCVKPGELKNMIIDFVKRRQDKIAFWPGQPLDKLRLGISADSYGSDYSMYLNILNTPEPNAPNNYLTICSINGSKDTKSVIIEIIKPLFEEIDNINNSKITIDFPETDYRKPELHVIETKNLPENVFAKDGVRGPLNLLCVHPTENNQGSFSCGTCRRKFDENEVLF